LIVQQAIKGDLHDVTACSKNGSVVSMLSQHRLVALYDFGGGGIVNKTTYEPVPMEYAMDILRHLDWDGVLLFDFIKDKEGNYYLLECNPKIWGTTQLTIEAGLNVAQQLIDLFVLEKDIPAIKNYDIDVVYKWWFPECLFHWFHRPRTVGRITRRVTNTLRRYGAKRSVNNLRRNDISHLLGMVLDRAEL
jgi:predicted ATP-grasp superfamily ATP-dependent carboligase